MNRSLLPVMLLGSFALLFPVAIATTPVVAHPPGAHGAHGPAVDGDHDKAMAFHERRLEVNPNDTVSLGHLGLLQLEAARTTGDHHGFQVAELTFRRLITADPLTRAAHGQLARTLLGQHRFREALPAAREAVRRSADQAGARALLAEVHLALGNLAEAEALAAQVLEARIDLASLAGLALVREARGDFESARSLLGDAIQAGRLLDAPRGEIGWCYTLLGEIDLAQGRLDDATRRFEAAITQDAAAPAPHWRLAQTLRRRGDLKSAHRVIKTLVERDDRPAHCIELGRICEDLARLEEAATWIDRAERRMLADLEHDELAHVRELIELWLHRGRHFGRAAELARAELSEVRRDAGGCALTAWAMHLAGDTAAAVPLIDEALGRRRGDARMVLRAGLIHAAASPGGLRGPRLLRTALSMAGGLEREEVALARAVLASATEREEPSPSPSPA